ncbi:MAG: histidinol phosphate aminotransferase [Chlorobi bacterium]|nr:histidinol phosphate aminotransferase [Chlorobiota bacterium]
MSAFDIDRVLRPHMLDLEPYRSARHDFSDGVLLDANENPYGLAPAWAGNSLNRYPDPVQNELCSRLADLNGVERDSVFVSASSDEAIDLLLRLFCSPGRDAVAICEPTYGMYRVAAAVHDVRVLAVPLADGFQLDVAAVADRCAGDIPPKLIFCCSPNNPTGNLLDGGEIVRLCSAVDAVVVVDEAYIEFADAESLARRVRGIPNLVVIRTLSKAWALAGVRIGYAIASPRLIGYLRKIKPPYNVGSLAAAVALETLADPGRMRRVIDEVAAERERVAGLLRGLRSIETVYPSNANFLLIKCAGATELQRRLAATGIIVRDRSMEPGLSGCLRITIGTPRENDLLISALTAMEGMTP